MEKSLDIFEVIPEHGLIWKCAVDGMEEGSAKLGELAANYSHEFRLIHLATATVISIVNPTRP